MVISSLFLLVVLTTLLINLGNPKLIFYFYITFFLSTVLGYLYINQISTKGYYLVLTANLMLLLMSLLRNFDKFFIHNLQCELQLFKFGKLCFFYNVEYTLILDKISYSFVLLTTFISFFVFLYTYVYFKNDASKVKFFFFLCNFV